MKKLFFVISLMALVSVSDCFGQNFSQKVDQYLPKDTILVFTNGSIMERNGGYLNLSMRDEFFCLNLKTEKIIKSGLKYLNKYDKSILLQILENYFLIIEKDKLIIKNTKGLFRLLQLENQ